MPLGLAKAVGGPGSIGFLVLCVAIGLGLIYLWPRHRALGRAWLLLVFGGYLVLGVPWIANAIANRLPACHFRGAGAAGPIDTLIVLAGDNAVGRVEEAERVYRTASPTLVLVSGENWLGDRLEEVGIAKSRIQYDRLSVNTREQMINVQRFLARRPAHQAAIIVSRLQLPRVAALAEESNLDAILIPSPIDTEPPTKGLRLFVPTYAALRVSRDALYEHAALTYYRWRGWIRLR